MIANFYTFSTFYKSQCCWTKIKGKIIIDVCKKVTVLLWRVPEIFVQTGQASKTRPTSRLFRLACSCKQRKKQYDIELQLKMAFSEIMGFKNLYFHLIFTKFQNFHRNWVKISLQVCENSYSPTCKLDFSQKWWEICNFVKIWWKTKFPNRMISKNVTFTLDPKVELDAETLVLHSGSKFLCFLV